MRKLILNLAMSLDGYIADRNGEYAWIAGDGNGRATEQRWEHSRFLEEVDTVIMGRHCYEQGMHLDYPDKRVYVATSHEKAPEGNCVFLGKELIDTIQMEKKQEGKNLYLFGGGILADHFIQRDMIEEYVIGIIPILLGKGRPLFLGGTPQILLELKEHYMEDGICVLHYQKRNS